MDSDLNGIFSTLKGLLEPYAPPLVAKKDLPGAYDLWSLKDLVIEGRKRSEIYFAGLVLYKTYVGFYYMPVYAEPEIKRVFPAELLALLKGKSCFHVKALDERLIGEVRDALDFGFKAYQERGWV